MVTTTVGPPAAAEPGGAGDGHASTPVAPAATGACLRLRSGAEIARWRDVTVGAAFDVEEATAAVIGGLRRAAAGRGRLIAELARRGALERARGRQRATAAVQGAVTAVATSSLVSYVVDAQLERVLRPVVVVVLDEVLLLLEQEPDTPPPVDRP